MPRRRVMELDTVVAAAMRSFHRSGTVDMEQLARELAISRATLYRLVGSRDRLLGEVLWRQGQASLLELLGGVPGSGYGRLVELATRFNERLIRYPSMRAFLDREPETAFRVLFMPDADVHRRFVALWHRLLVAELGETVSLRGTELSTQQLAYVFVRVGESMLYADLLAGREPDVGLARTVQSLLAPLYDEATTSL